MKKLVDMMLEDLSDRNVFMFRIICGSCGTEYAGRAAQFSKADIVPPTQAKKIIYDALYEQEYRDARQTAVRDAAENLNYCPICRRLVCNRCFLICDDLDMCKGCATHLEETGSPVIPDMSELIV